MSARAKVKKYTKCRSIENICAYTSDGLLLTLRTTAHFTRTRILPPASSPQNAYFLSGPSSILPMVVRENVEAVVVPQHDRVSGGVERRRRKFPAGRVRRVVERSLHTAVHVVENHLQDTQKPPIKSAPPSLRICWSRWADGQEQVTCMWQLLRDRPSTRGVRGYTKSMSIQAVLMHDVDTCVYASRSRTRTRDQTCGTCAQRVEVRPFLGRRFVTEKQLDCLARGLETPFCGTT